MHARLWIMCTALQGRHLDAQNMVQLESLKATTDTKEVSFKIAYGLPLAEMLRWGLYISGAFCFIPAVKTPVV